MDTLKIKIQHSKFKVQSSKFNVLIALYTVFFTCTVSQAKPVTPEKAAAVAGKICKIELNPHYKLNARTCSVADPAYYIFTGKETGGFVIVSGDDITKPILGYSIDGMMTDDGSLPPNMQAWLDDMEQQIQQARQQGIRQSTETARQWQTPDVGETLLELKTALWRQGSPFNWQCPLENGDRCITGCVPTAYAILMKYYEYPSQGWGTTASYIVEKNGVVVPERNLEHSYDWNQMPMEYKSGEYTQAQADAVATLMADIGAGINAAYGSEETSAGMDHEGIFRHFSFNPGTRHYKEDYSNADWNTILKNELGKMRPILYRGAPSADDGGHAFLLVGCTDQDYYLVNWGWGGYCNGAFALDALNPGDHNYNGVQQAYLDCVPSDMLPSVAIVNDTHKVPSLKAAFAIASTDGSTTQIKMLRDATITRDRVLENTKVLLDLNGCSLTISRNGIYNYGQLTVADTHGSGIITVKNGNCEVISNYRELWIQGGEYLNVSTDVGSSDYRRCIWSGEGSKTFIDNGKFTAPHQTLCFNGEAVIEDGEYTSTDNSSVVSNYNTSGQLTINGGKFTNTGSRPDDTDYRRCIWTKEGTTTLITDGVFTTNSQSQAVCFNGNATINGGTFVNKGTGIDCASNAYVTITDCKMGGTRNVHAWTGATLQCFGGLYAQPVYAPYLASGYECIHNDDASTRGKYPYRVVNSTGIDTLAQDDTQESSYYGLDGILRTDKKSGLTIIRQKNGKTIKHLCE